jgi:hypothetical protein
VKQGGKFKGCSTAIPHLTHNILLIFFSAPVIEPARICVILYKRAFPLSKKRGEMKTTILILALLLPVSASAEELVYDQNWNLKCRIEDGRIYDKNWQLKGHIQDGKLYDKNWQLKGRIEEGKSYDRIYDPIYELEVYRQGDRLYDRTWTTKGYIKGTAAAAGRK